MSDFIVTSKQSNVPHEPDPYYEAVKRYEEAVRIATETFDAAKKNFNAAIESAWTDNPEIAAKIGNYTTPEAREYWIDIEDQVFYANAAEQAAEAENRRADEEQRITDNLEQNQ